MKLSDYAHERWLIISALGGKCQSCGTDEFDVLELDHINGDGFLQHTKYGQRHGTNRAQLRRERLAGRIHEVYQVLCANCHRKKTKQNGENVGKRRDITDITTPGLPLFDWGKIPSFDERYLKVPND